jgi:RNA polymerase sigma-54 factor
MKPGFQMQAGQHMTMTPQLLQSIRLLQLSSLELEQEVQQALENNVMLESEEEAVGDDAPAVELADTADTASTETPVTGCDVAADDKVQADYDWSSAEGWSGGEPSGDDEPIEARTAAPESDDLRVRALQQLRQTLASEQEARIAIAIVEAVDDNGYLERALIDIADELDVELNEVEAVLAKVQSVEPSGFAARDLRECLLLQLSDLPARTPGRIYAQRIVEDGLELLARHDYVALSEQVGIPVEKLHVAIGLVLALNPKPGASLSSGAQAVVPDLVVTGEPGNWKVELNPATLPRVRVNGLYERLLNGGANHRGLREQLQEARWLVRGLEMRHETLLKTARVVFERQAGFLRNGEEGMAPLTLREVADAIQMHESTVSRITTSKYVQTPWGVYEFKAFFPSLLGGIDGETSGTAVRAMIRRIIDGESARSPLCDGAIAAILHRGGVRVARRTVAKYREAMKIAPAKERRSAAQRSALRMAG